jgi:tetratricopeptide (TPR) repeat protein
LLADLDLQHGRCAAARQGYDDAIEQDPSWDNIARLAHLEFKLGDDDAADRHFEQAEDELTAKEMRHYAWLELQRGLLDLKRGRHAAAREHYERAERAYSGHWMTAEHMAELLATCGECDAALAMYERVVAEHPRPELMQALGELCAQMGRSACAESWFDQALGAYRASAERGEVHYLHHLADFYADVREDGVQALRWAGADLALRENPATLAAWAWALYRAGRAPEALEPIQRSLASGIVDAHVLHCAATIHRAAGAMADADRYAQQARERNPHLHGFHVHR